MPKQIFINLAVKDLNRSVEFFTKLGYTFNQQFTDETATCMVISDTIFVMLLTEPKFKSFIKTQLADAAKTTEVLLALNQDNRAEVDKHVDMAIANGATEAWPPTDHGFMYTRSYHDLDGHIWEIFYMDPNFVMPTEAK